MSKYLLDCEEEEKALFDSEVSRYKKENMRNVFRKFMRSFSLNSSAYIPLLELELIDSGG